MNYPRCLKRILKSGLVLFCFPCRWVSCLNHLVHALTRFIKCRFSLTVEDERHFIFIFFRCFCLAKNNPGKFTLIWTTSQIARLNLYYLHSWTQIHSLVFKQTLNSHGLRIAKESIRKYRHYIFIITFRRIIVKTITEPPQIPKFVATARSTKGNRQYENCT